MGWYGACGAILRFQYASTDSEHNQPIGLEVKFDNDCGQVDP